MPRDLFIDKNVLHDVQDIYTSSITIQPYSHAKGITITKTSSNDMSYIRLVIASTMDKSSVSLYLIKDVGGKVSCIELMSNIENTKSAINQLKILVDNIQSTFNKLLTTDDVDTVILSQPVRDLNKFNKLNFNVLAMKNGELLTPVTIELKRSSDRVEYLTKEINGLVTSDTFLAIN